MHHLEPVWSGLLADAGCDTIFLTYEWITAWLRWIGGDVDPLVLVAKDDYGAVVGIAPLMLVTHALDGGGTERRIEFIGAPNSDYSDFIVRGERAPVLRAFFEYLTRKPRDWDCIWLREIEQGSLTIDAARRAFASPWFPALVLPGTWCPTVMIEGHQDEILQEIARKKYIGKKDLAKSIAHIERQGPVRIRHCATLEDARSQLPVLFRMHRERWADTDPSKFESESYERFYYELLDRLWSKGRVAVTVMELDGKPMAVSFAFPYKQTWTNHTWAYDRAFAKLSPGTLLIQFMISDAVTNGYREFDFTRGAEAYKDRFANAVKQNTDLMVYGDRSKYLHEWSGQAFMRGKKRLMRRNPRIHDALRRIKRSVGPARGVPAVLSWARP